MNGTAFAVINNKTQQVIEIRMTQEEANLAKNFHQRAEGASYSVKPCTWQITQ